MRSIKNLIVKQPALILGLALAALGLVSTFGLIVSQEQVAAVVAVGGAILALLSALITRSQVTHPVAAPVLPSGTGLVVVDAVTGEKGSGVV